MKKNYLFLAAATTLFAACVQTDVVTDIPEPQQQAISFDAFANKTTRAEITNNNLSATTLKVWGWKTTTSNQTPYDVFNGISVKNQNGDWTYSDANDTKYWDQNASYKFYAASPFASNVTIDSDVSDAIIKITNVTGGAAADVNTIDYLITRELSSEVGSNPSEVDFTLSHIMTKLTVKVNYSSELKVKNNVTLNALKMEGWNNNAGIFTQSANPEWTIDTPGTSGSYDFPITNNGVILASASDYTAGSYLVVPQTGVNLKFTISYNLDGEVFNAQVGTMNGQSWGSNTHYQYTITIKPNAIEFGTTTLNDWDDPTSNQPSINIE